MADAFSKLIARGMIILVTIGLIGYGIHFALNNTHKEESTADFVRLVASTFQKILLQAHEEWTKVGGGVGVSMNFLGRPVNDVVFSDRGWPVGASNGQFFPRVTLGSNLNESELDKVCAQLFNNMLVNAPVHAEAGRPPCVSDFCAVGQQDVCQYFYSKNPEEGFIYRVSKGSVEVFLRNL